MVVASLAAIGCDDKKSTPKAGTTPTMNPQRTTEPPHTTTPEPARTTSPGAASTTKPKESAPVLPPKDDKDKKDGKDGGK